MTARLLRDAYGVPHVRADSLTELAEAQGRVTAHDRGGQIQVEHWRTEGRLAEHVGEPGVAWDRFARGARLADTARRAYDALEEDDRELVTAYVAGVNAVLPEADWPDWAPLGILHVAHALFSDLPALLWREHVHRSLGPAHGDAVVDLFRADAGAAGSNAWAVHGSRTRTGLPILAGDPHRVIEIPGVYQQVRLACPGVDVVGLAFPGVPGVAHFGHAGSVAWGITNAMAHHVDVFRERLRGTESGGVEAYGARGWEPAACGTEDVRVRDSDSVEVPWVETARGVVVSGLGALPAPGAETTAYSARFPARVGTDLGVAAIRPLLRARSAEDVAAAFGRWVDPVNRLLVGDREGTVLSLTVGRVPDTGAAARRLPRDAWCADADEVGWRALADVRQVDAFAVDANERPEDPARAFGYAYAPPHRATRISARLSDLVQGERRVAVADLHDVHADTLSLGAEQLLGRHLPDATDTGLTPAARTLARRLHAWDRRMDADSVDAAAYAAWRSALVTRVAALPALASLYEPHGMDAVFAPWLGVPARVGDALLSLLGAQGVTVGIDAPALAREALEEVAQNHGARTWGDTHRLDPVRVLAGVRGAAFAAFEPTALSGDTDTVRATASTPGVSDVCWRGSVARWIWDLSDRDASRWGVPFGAAGDPGDAHATDQLATWLDAGTVPVVTAWDALDPEDLP